MATLIAPDDKAFTNLCRDLDISREQLLDNTDLLTKAGCALYARPL